MKDTKKSRQTSESEEELTQDNIIENNMNKNLGLKVQELSQQVTILTEQLQDAQRREQLALADYQNLVRRTTQERSRFARLAARNFVEDFLQPLGHLTLASEQLDDPGLNMVVTQLWQALEQNGLEKIDAMGKDFDINTMEATDSSDKSQKVVKIVKDGYTLNNEVIQHAKVILD